MVQVALPARRVLSAAVTANRGPVQYGLDAATHAGCGLGLYRPDGFNRLHDQSRVDGTHRQMAWIGFSAASMLYMDAGGFHGGNPGASIRKKNFQAGG